MAGGSAAFIAGLESAFSAVKQPAVLLLWWLGMQAALVTSEDTSHLYPNGCCNGSAHSFFMLPVWPTVPKIGQKRPLERSILES